MLETQNSNQNNTIKLQILEGDRLVISMHDFNPFRNCKKFEFDYTKHKNTVAGIYMTTKNYIETIKTKHKELWNLHFDNENCYFITLIFKDQIEFRNIEQKIRSFCTALRRHYGKFEYVRAIEMTQKRAYHVHMIVQFNEFPLDLCATQIKKLWKLGKSHLKPIYDVRGNIQYITKCKDNNLNYETDDYSKILKNVIQRRCPHLTYFPKNARIISKSDEFGRKLNKNEYKNIPITKKQANKILKYFQNKFKSKNGSFVRIDGHYYKENEKSIYRNYCIDKVYIRDTNIDEIFKILAS